MTNLLIVYFHLLVPTCQLIILSTYMSNQCVNTASNLGNIFGKTRNKTIGKEDELFDDSEDEVIENANKFDVLEEGKNSNSLFLRMMALRAVTMTTRSQSLWL